MRILVALTRLAGGDAGKVKGGCHGPLAGVMRLRVGP